MLVVGLVVTMIVTPALATPSTTATQPGEHTLVIEVTNGSVGYSVTVSGSLSFKRSESGDAVAGHTATGQVGGYPWEKTSTDATDVIRFTGQLENFEYNGNDTQIRVTLDGEQIDPNSLLNTPAPTPTVTNVPTTSHPTVTETATRTATPRPSTTPSPVPTTHASHQTRTSATPPGDRTGLDWLSSELVAMLIVGSVLAILFLRRD